MAAVGAAGNLDRMVGDYYEPEDVDDLINWLNADD